MRECRGVVAALLWASLLGLAGQAAAQPAVVFEEVNVIPMDRERVVERQTVVVRDGRIAEIGPAGKVKPPQEALRVAGRGKYLMPGFGEMHGHLPGPNAPPPVVESILFLFVANGVTTVRGMLGGASNLQMRDRIAAGSLLGPALFVAGPAFSGAAVTSAEAGARMVREQKAAGYDLLKIQEGLRRDVYDAVAASALEAGIRFGGHVPNDVGLHRALEARQSSIDHLDNFVDALEADSSPLRGADPATRAQQLIFHIDEGKIPALAAAASKAGAWVVPTMALWEVFSADQTGESLAAGRPELRYMPAQTVAQWVKQKNAMREKNPDPKAGARLIEVRRKILRGVRDGGVKIMFGTDAPQLFSVPGFSIHHEMQILVACGLTPWEVMAAGTRNVAEYLGAEKEFGSVAPGRRADLVLLDANPLENVSHFARRAGVMVRGRWLPEREIQKRLEQIAEAARS